ncbi:molybdenum cofactor guanylyltransferase [Desulfosudis oleivorans]|uniref:Molybdenum cofactor guanylyltransferase n=1 Tax=Desulfosudis oleivorans (strain DSM 6200 / JCM 39069 / Hxd3) TaxID=96561 RepID=MOBA_DESOH|nr:molybdenum cofactor guanylyltransferase [Desulfosudis oleivorans]A9A059.1 RecName: Full=Molybdenum cofactor guanylyltransferase; Short=MoCo guanylyltransferase; AltName: Full=GTP:molybdopterin guanylyltransferase; AltName: Full=Mo-MPT guanylyltransferase; AltName: Full=Molybdopterin guanylyltransferase; AltName: Full=Molybdopterin-guanine dinucleotide synthase; Short=MGD synthase [Desulfosudis oleivorans Hxd3]ABW68978.1 molybdopterin-guanine dinucleotide biosynthesis protein A [Desulfosudis ol
MDAVTGIILAGGESRRFGGGNKAFRMLDGRTMIDRVHDTVKSVCDDMVIVANTPLDYLGWNAVLATDLFDFRGSLVGIHAGLMSAGHEYAFISACDTPFLKQAVIKTIIGGIEDHIDVVVPEKKEGMEPLCAVYSRRCLEVIERHLHQGRMVIKAVYNKLRVRTISEKRLRAVDPDLVSFWNINTKEELEKAEAAIKAGRIS